MVVKNLHNTGGRPAPTGYGSWLEWWMDQKGVTKTPDCANHACGKRAILGGHVKKDSSDDNAWYIVPLCDGCNTLEDPFTVSAADMAAINP